ncbi:FkbM family methyltransferase [Arenibacterium halophilum]|uniref:FkbM family methyltransferase n=1 Tax=Arenibacterium halophilum TaxID=2583821 RepID=A0ABY2XCM0_9RHOB|nr:FkbM family methyltransferase [Arenibacterium halophilum]TMV13765.1 FkbM family methyltransferase [Arenibacterium halophilum]
MSHFLKNTKIIRRDRLRELKNREHGYFDLEFIKALEPEHRAKCVDLLETSCSQVRQDVFALSRANYKRNGFFVEFGATNGVELSNSYMLERDYGWTGILAEPAKGWHDDLRANRSARIDTRCVWKESGETVNFVQTASAINSAISSFVKTSRKVRGQSYDVETVSLNDLLTQHDAPSVIDFISIDTEGSEFDILNALDFDRWSFHAMTVEHNYEPQREDVHALLTSKGYRRVFETASRFDDWYVKDI